MFKQKKHLFLSALVNEIKFKEGIYFFLGLFPLPFLARFVEAFSLTSFPDLVCDLSLPSLLP